jgi:hypothetical protein
VAIDDRVWAGSHRRTLVAFLAVVTAGYAAFGSTTRANTLSALVAVVLPVTAVTVWVFRHRPPTIDPSPLLPRTTKLWACVAAAVLVWEIGVLIGEHTVGQYEYPTLSLLAEPALQEPVIRFAAWVAWLVAGWRLVRR